MLLKHDEVAASIPPLPQHCLDLCSRLGGLDSQVSNFPCLACLASWPFKGCPGGKDHQASPHSKDLSKIHSLHQHESTPKVLVLIALFGFLRRGRRGCRCRRRQNLFDFCSWLRLPGYVLVPLFLLCFRPQFRLASGNILLDKFALHCMRTHLSMRFLQTQRRPG